MHTGVAEAAEGAYEALCPAGGADGHVLPIAAASALATGHGGHVQSCGWVIAGSHLLRRMRFVRKLLKYMHSAERLRFVVMRCQYGRLYEQLPVESCGYEFSSVHGRRRCYMNLKFGLPDPLRTRSMTSRPDL